MAKATFILQPLPHPARANCKTFLDRCPDGMVVTIQPPKRTLAQNAKMWALLTEISHQVEWYGQFLTPEEWKDVFTASLKRQKVVPGLEGGFVVCGMSTSQMSAKDISDLIEVIYAFGAPRGVKFSEVA